MIEQFFMTVNSSSSCEFRHQNRPSNFKVHLGRILELQGRWEVALFELIIPSTLNNARKGTCQIIHEKTSFDPETGELGFKGDRGFSVIDLDSELYFNIGSLVKEINQKVHPSMLCQLNDSKKVSVYINEIDDRGEVSSFRFSPILCDILGLPRINYVGGHTMNGLFEPILSSNAILQSDVPANLNKGLPHSLSVCSSIIEDQIVNNSHARILRTFDTDAHKYKHGFSRKVEFSKLIFLPVSRKKVEFIDIYIKDDLDKEASFSHGTLTAVLLFRKVGNE
jgi:hypothetical protein